MDYNTYLKETYGTMEINLVKHDISPTGCPCYIEVLLGHNPRDKGSVAKDLSNYLFRLGLNFQSCPEYLGKGKKTTIRYYMTWEDIDPIRENIAKAFDKPVLKQCLPFEFHYLVIQNSARGIRGKFIDK